MTDYAIIIVIATTVSTLLYALVRWRYGRGLLSRIFGVVMPFVALVALLGIVLGKAGINFVTISIAVAVGVFFVVGMITVVQRTIVQRLESHSNAILHVSKRLSTTAQETAASAEEQASAVAQVTSSIDEIHRMSQSTSDNSQAVVQVAEEALSKGHEGLNSVREVVDIMNRFSMATDFVQVIGEVAEQSNLLAVNAGIEASKAGEFGRGFSVVANEVRNLAEQSREAAKQIRGAIDQTKVGQVGLSRTDAVISELGTVLQESSDRARQISGAAVQQSAGIKQISEAMSNITRGGSDTARAAKEIQKAIDDLNEVSRDLVTLVNGRQAQTQAQL